MIGRTNINFGTVEMNKEHKYNVLSNGFIDDVRRSLQSMEIEELMQVVVLKSKNNEIFSYGTDLNYLYNKKKRGETDKIDAYIEKLYNFMHFLANYHKPLICIGTGSASKYTNNY